MKNEILAILFGKKIANRLIVNHPNTQLVFTFESVGDQCMELAYLRTYQKENGLNRIGILTTNPNHALFKYFSDAYDELITISKKEHEILLKFYKSDFGQIYRRKEPRILCAFYTAFVRSDLLFANKYVRLSDLEKLIYRIPLDTMPCEIKELDYRDWIDKLVKQGTITESTVLLNPYANSCSGVPITCFETIAKKLKEKGYTVITGVHNRQKPIEGTISVSFPLEKTISLANHCKAVIGLRSGFMDLCSFSKTSVIAITHDSYELSDATRLEDWWPQNKKIKTFIYEETELFVEEMMKYIGESNYGA